jgi:mannonate dehydratase
MRDSSLQLRQPVACIGEFTMKLGYALGGTGITRDNLQFARQAGVTHVVLHLTDYGYKREELPERYKGAAGFTGRPKLWDYEYLTDIKKMVNDEGLIVEALENFNPYFWYDVLLDGPRKQEQMENLKRLIRDVGKAGIPIFGYNFSLAGVWGLTSVPEARGRAPTAAFLNPEQKPIPKGMVWNMVYDPDSPEGDIGKVTEAQLWQRAEDFLKQMLPVAEEAGVVMAAHPDDPPMSEIRGTARLVHQPRLYKRLFDLVPSAHSKAELCVGTLAEMTETDLYEWVETYAQAGKVAYVHLRNVRGKVPNYVEVFVDEGDTDIARILGILHRAGYDGIITPDHAPAMNCPAPGHAAMAYQLGYLRALINMVDKL